MCIRDSSRAYYQASLVDDNPDQTSGVQFDTPQTGTTGINTAGASDNTQTGTNANLPPYYALAFIMKT